MASSPTATRVTPSPPWRTDTPCAAPTNRSSSCASAGRSSSANRITPTWVSLRRAGALLVGPLGCDGVCGGSFGRCVDLKGQQNIDEMVDGLHSYGALLTSDHSKRFTILTNIHPFMHTFTRRRWRQRCQATASSSGAVRARRLAQGHLDTLARGSRGSNRRPSGYKSPHSTSLGDSCPDATQEHVFRRCSSSVQKDVCARVWSRCLSVESLDVLEASVEKMFLTSRVEEVFSVKCVERSFSGKLFQVCTEGASATSV